MPPFIYPLSIFLRRGRQAISIMSAAPTKRVASTHIGVMLSSADVKITNELPQMSGVHIRQVRPRFALLFFIFIIFLPCAVQRRAA